MGYLEMAAIAMFKPTITTTTPRTFNPNVVGSILASSLSLVVAYARAGSPKFEAAAVRWLARLALEGREVGLADVQLAAAALGCLRGRRHEKAEKTLLRLL